MISAFLNSWPLFQEAYLAALSCGVLLGVLGVWVVARDELFLAAAVAQASVLGLALALTFEWPSSEIPAIGLSVAVAWAAGKRVSRGGLGRDEVTAWAFLLGSSLAVLVLARSPLGMKNVQSVLSSSILGASPFEAGMFGLFAAGALAMVRIQRERFVLILLDPVMASAVGLSVGTWSMAISTTLGLASGMAIRSTGLLFTFGCLVLPALVAKNLCREVRPMFWVAPLVASSAVIIGLVLAHHFDFPPGQLVVAVLAALLVAAWVWRELRTRMEA